jgi:hypothetical protein
MRVESHGELCATGEASLRDERPGAPNAGDLPPAATTRVPADERSLAPETLLGMRPWRVTADVAERYLADLRETAPLYARDGVVHPGLILRTCNWALMHNVVLGPWIHVGSTVQNLAIARVGDEVSVRARVSANYERRGRLQRPHADRADHAHGDLPAAAGWRVATSSPPAPTACRAPASGRHRRARGNRRASG